jgi:hypothetical protein
MPSLPDRAMIDATPEETISDNSLKVNHQNLIAVAFFLMLLETRIAEVK